MSAPERRPQLFLTDADFDAYGAAGRARLELRQRMLGFARRVVGRLDALGIDMEVVATDGRPTAGAELAPSQRVLLWRAAAARADLERLRDPRPIGAVLSDPAPYARHACLELEVDPSAVQVGFELTRQATIDGRNLRARLADAGRALELRAALEALPEQFTLGLLHGAEPPSEAREIEIQTLRALLDRAEVDDRSLWIGWRLPRDVVVTHAALLDEQLEDAIVALAPVYKLVAWAPDNDLLVLEREVQAAREERARQNDDLERTRTEWERRRAEKRRPAAGAPPTRDSKRSSQRGIPTRAAREAEALRDQRDHVKESETQTQTPSPPAVRAAPPAKRPMLRRRPPSRVIDIDPSVPIDKGVRVRVLAGPFEGKVGVVQEVDGKGQARVMLGLLAMWLAARDLVASVEGKGRPVLGSSHRKPGAKP